MRSFKAFVIAAVAAPLLGGLGAPVAHAQAPPKEPSPFRLYIGAFFPTNSDTKERVGSTQFSWGASYDLPSKKPGPGTAAIFFDGMWANGDTYNGTIYTNREITFHYLGIGPEYRFYPGSSKDQMMVEPDKSRFYLGGGAGIYFLSARITDHTGYYVSDIDNEVRFGGKVFLGFDIGKSFLIEGDYTWPGITEAQGWNARFGFRF